jgi:TRAP transporter 4TM/12TM fusion protein
MKSSGYQPTFAAAVETCASTGSYFMPPIMGAAAFLMATFANVSYLSVCVVAIVPSLLFFLCIFVQVHLRAKKLRLQGLKESEIPSLKRVIWEGGHLLSPMVVIIAGLILGYGVTLVAIAGLLTVILSSLIRKETRLNSRKFLIALGRATEQTVGIGLCVVAVGIIQGAILVSGLGMRLTLAVENIAGGNMLAGLILAAAICIIMGMGIAPTMVYYMAYIFVIPSLIKMGVPVLGAHFFALIYGGVANITPPVAVAAYTAANIAGAPPMRTGFEAAKLGFAAYAIPFMLVYHPAIMLVGSPSLIDSAIAILTAVLGLVSICSAFEGWLLKRNSNFHRFILFAGGLLLITPSIILGAIGFSAGILVIVIQMVEINKER